MFHILEAVLKTIEFIKQQVKHFTNNVILTDPLSTIKSLDNRINSKDMVKMAVI